MSLRSALKAEQNNCWPISELHLSDPATNKNNCMLHILSCVKKHLITVFWLKFYVTATCDIAFSLRFEAS